MSAASERSADQLRLVRWGRAVRRDLPWRTTRDPWAVLVSEVMAQQTPVARVIPFWERFMAAWPTPSAMAEAPLAEVLTQWKGLGYPRRARWLRQCAIDIVDRHGGSVPSGLDELMALPGIGGYTARAVKAFAFEHDVGLVDTNIARVLARRSGRRLTASEAQLSSDDFVPVGGAWEHNSALMDLGAMLCRPQPSCEPCPLRHGCTFAEGHLSEDPALRSAGVSRPQARFAGSHRQARGRLLAALAEGPVSVSEASAVADRDEAATGQAVASLISDSLVVEKAGKLSLPS